MPDPVPSHTPAALPTVSAVAPTYQRRAALPRFVDALLREPGLHELVLAVDGSTDGSAEWLEERARSDTRVKVLKLPNRGVGAARQAGIEAATGDVVLLLDDDVIAEPGLVAGHARRHAGSSGGKLVLGYMPNEWADLEPGRRGIALIYRRAYETHVERFARDPAFVLQGLWGGNLSMAREDFLRIGLEQLSIKRGQDDREFGIRCFKAGIVGEFAPELRARHLYDRSLPAFRRDCRFQGESRLEIHEVHADLVGEDLVRTPRGSEVNDDVGLGLPRAMRRVWPVLASDPWLPVATALLTAAFGLGVRVRSLRLESQAARAIGSLEVMRGVLDAS